MTIHGNYVLLKCMMFGNYTQQTQKYRLTRVLGFKAKIMVNLLCDYMVLTTCTFCQYLILTMSLNGQQLLWKKRLLGKLFPEKWSIIFKSLTFFTTAFFLGENIQVCNLNSIYILLEMCCVPVVLRKHNDAAFKPFLLTLINVSLHPFSSLSPSLPSQK